MGCKLAPDHGELLHNWIASSASFFRFVIFGLASLGIRNAFLTILCVVASSLLAAFAPVAFKLIIDRLPYNENAVNISLLTSLLAIYVFSQWLSRLFSK